MNIYENVERAARASGWTIYSLEKAAGFSHGAISKWRDAMPRVDSLQRVAKLLGVDINDLMKPKEAEG